MHIHRHKGVFFNIIYDGVPPQGLSEALGTGRVFLFLVVDPPRGRPVGGGGTHHT
jgi:hypothetical protein